ncbi:MAG: AMP-binding protein [Planctomycetota bacterium]
MATAVSLPIHEYIAQLETDGHVAARPIPWLAESGKDPKPFWDGLVASAASGVPTPLKSVALESYDFYHDMVKRHVAERAAFRWYDPDVQRFETFTVGELDMLCGRRAKEWEGRGVSAGQTVAIFLPMGPDFVLSLLTALKIGAVVTVMPRCGNLALKKLIETAAPDHIVTDPIYLNLLGDAKDKAIPADLPAATESSEVSGVYSANSPWAKLFSPFAPGPYDATPVMCDSGFLWALRDGILALGLKPNDLLLAPAVPLVPAQPSLLVATLLAGGVYCHVDLEHVKAKPALLDSAYKHVVVTREIRDIVLASAPKLGRAWKSWSRFVDEGGDPQTWAEFVSHAGLEPSRSCNYLVDSSAGGGIHFSMKRRLSKGGWNSYVLPAAGTEWFLTGASGADVRVSVPIGRFTFKKPGEEAALPGNNLVRSSRNRPELDFLGRTTPHRLGRTYPTEQVIAAIDPLPFVLESSVVPVSTGDLETPYQFSLVIFCGHELKPELATQQGDWRRLVEEAITREVGADALPDVVEFFPLYARRAAGLTDHEWVQSCYVAGTLHERARSVPYTLLTELRALVLGWEPPKAIPPPPAEGEQPPSDSPPPEEPPPSDSAPTDAPPTDAPPSDAPPSDAPPPEGEQPLTDGAPSSDAPPSDAPPTDAAPSDAAPVDAAPADAPPPSEPTTDAPPPAEPSPETTAGSDEATPPTVADGDSSTDGTESASGPVPNPESDVMFIVDDEADVPPPPPPPPPPSTTDQPHE